MSLNTQTQKWRVVEGAKVTPAIANSVLLGSEYIWDREASDQAVAMLWRSKDDARITLARCYIPVPRQISMIFHFPLLDTMNDYHSSQPNILDDVELFYPVQQYWWDESI